MSVHWKAFCLAACGLAVAGTAQGQAIGHWQVGGDGGLVWDEGDSVSVMVDFEARPTAIQPVYIERGVNIFTLFSNWSDFKVPRELGYVDGQRPRVWRAEEGGLAIGVKPSLLVDGDSLSYNPTSSAYGLEEWFTVDLGVPVPADVFGFYPPPRGFRSDGTPLEEDLIPAFEVSVNDRGDSAWLEGSGYRPIGTLIARVLENVSTDVRIEFPQQYVRYIRYRRRASFADEGITVVGGAVIADNTFASSGSAAKGTIGDFELFGEGVPQRVIYVSRVFDLGQELSFGRLFWRATPLRMVDGVPVEVDDAAATVEVEVRTGTDNDPSVYLEFTDTGDTVPVTRARYENDLRPPVSGQKGKPGLQAGIADDEDNWTFWTFPIDEPGVPLRMAPGSFLQFQVNLKSAAFADFVRLDSLWIEMSPPFVKRVFGEVAPLDNPRPARGFTEVTLGRMTDFVFDLRAEFDSDQQSGFDAVRVRTGTASSLRSLWMGQPLEEVDPARVTQDADGLTVELPRRVTRDANLPLRLVLATEIFDFATSFEGEVFDTRVENLPQQVNAGDASGAVSTNSLRVLGKANESVEAIQALDFSTSVLTPNGDGANDALTVAYTLFRLPNRVPVWLRVYGLDGRLVATVDQGLQGSGPQQAVWDGRDGGGGVLPPGIYLVEVAVQAETATLRRMRPVGVAY